MKKSISLILVFLLLFALGACNVPVEDDPPEEPFVGEKLQIVTYYERIAYGDHIRTKTLSDEWTQGLIQALIQAPETGETVEKISDKEVTESSKELPVPDQTKWLITGNYIFRLIDNRLYRVDSHLGAGRELEYSEELQKMVYDASHYAPYNSYRGTWENGTLEVEHVFENKSTVDITVEQIVQTSNEKYNIRYKATITLVSTRNQTVEFWYQSQQSEDNLGSTETMEIQLRKGKKETIEIEFYGFDITFVLNLRADNTHTRITIQPK